MKLSQFDYMLPSELIAQNPAEPRDRSRLLTLDKGTWKIQDLHFYDIYNLLWENDVLVLNETKVIKARLTWSIENSLSWLTQVEIFLHKKKSENTWDCLVHPGKKLKIGTEITFKKNGEVIMRASIKEISHDGRIVEFDMHWEKFLDLVEQIGETPLPPYIKDKSSPSERYQTVYSRESWSVAAPTAGLHFTQELLEKLQKKWVKIEKVLLHVWLGTFKWVEVDDITQHQMHSEFCTISQDTANRLNCYKKEGKRIVAVGTTSVRTLESFAISKWRLVHGEKETNIFIYPGYEWKFVDGIITNFHLPKSTLLMLVSSFSGQENIKKAYLHGVDQKYRFFSFGDAMFLQ